MGECIDCGEEVEKQRWFYTRHEDGSESVRWDYICDKCLYGEDELKED